MSDNLPFDIQVEIIKRVPVKSLLQFRSVSTTWKSLIDSSSFIGQYSSDQTHLFVSNPRADWYDYEKEMYVSFVDDHTFPQHKVHLDLPPALNYYDVIGCSNGLLCFYDDVLSHTMAVWNISIRKGVVVAVPNVCHDGIYSTDLGFGVCHETTELKIVKIRHIKRWNDVISLSCIPWQVEVYTLSSRTWRSPCSTNLPRKSVRFDHYHVFIDGFIYWFATDGGFRVVCNMVISFDVTTEEFREVNLPDRLACRPISYLSMSKLRESLVVLERRGDSNNPLCVVWMMEDGVPKSFRKLFNVKVNTPCDSIKGFRKSGVPIVELEELEYNRVLVVYEPYSHHTDNLGIARTRCSLSVYPYTETLFLLDQPDLIV